MAVNTLGKSVDLVLSEARPSCEANEYEWIERQIASLREGRLADVDRINLAEFLTEMNISSQREIGSKFAVLLSHMLKILKQPEMHTRSSNLSIVREQAELGRAITRNPGLRRFVPSLYEDAYHDAVRYAAAETGIGVGDFPSVNPWQSWEWVVDEYVPPQPPVPPLRPVRNRRKSK